MMEDLQQAYAAYQQALYHLTDPKVSALVQYKARIQLIVSRSRNCGMALAFYMIAMAPLSMPKKRFRKSCTCNPILRKRTRYTSASA